MATAGDKPLSKPPILLKQDKVNRRGAGRAGSENRTRGNGMRGAQRLGVAALLAFAAPVAVLAQDAVPAGDWPTINRDLAATRYSPLDEINKSNVGKLALKWSYAMKGFNTAAPLVVNGTMYFPVANRIVALDADTGQE
jgi:hypothetical protein